MRAQILSVVLPVLVVLSCGGQRQLPSSAVQSIPLEEASRSRGVIADVVATVGANGDLNLVWRVFDEAHGKNEYWYTRAEMDGWRRPIPLDGPGTLAKLVSNEESLQLFCWSIRIERFVKGIATWGEMGPVGREPEHVVALDALANGTETIVAYLAYDIPIGGGDSKTLPMRLVVAELRPDVAPIYHDLETFPSVAMWSVGPRLVRWKNEIHIVCDVSTEGGTRLVHSYRADGAMDWSSLVDVASASTASGIKGLALAATGDRLFLFSANGVLLGSESTDGRSWAPAKKLTSLDLISTGYRVGRNLAAAGDSSGILVVWIDRKSTEAGLVKADVRAISEKSASTTLDHLAKRSPIPISPSAGPVAAVVAPDMNVVWATDREIFYVPKSKL